MAKKKELKIALGKTAVIEKLNENLDKMLARYEQMKIENKSQIVARKEYFKKVLEYAATNLEIETINPWGSSFKIEFDGKIPFDEVAITVSEHDIEKYLESIEKLKKMIMVLHLVKEDDVPFSMVEEVMSYI